MTRTLGIVAVLLSAVFVTLGAGVFVRGMPTKQAEPTAKVVAPSRALIALWCESSTIRRSRRWCPRWQGCERQFPKSPIRLGILRAARGIKLHRHGRADERQGDRTQ